MGGRIDYALNGRRQAVCERNLDKDDRLVRQRRVEEPERTAIGSEAAAQIIPAADLVYGFVLDQTFKNVCWCRPVELFEAKEATVEPATQ